MMMGGMGMGGGDANGAPRKKKPKLPLGPTSEEIEAMYTKEEWDEWFAECRADWSLDVTQSVVDAATQKEAEIRAKQGENKEEGVEATRREGLSDWAKSLKVVAPYGRREL